MPDIRWGSYHSFEGPWSPGTFKFELPSSPTFEDEVLATITATEGGRWDALNRYDSCIDTQGLIQWCNRAPQHSVDGMYASIAARDPELLKPITSFFGQRGYAFKEGRWVKDDGVLVDSPKLQAELYFLNASGAKSGWDEESKVYAKKAAEAALLVWQSPTAREVQGRWTVRRLHWFILEPAKGLFGLAPDTPVGRAFKAMYWSFAANNPKKASEALTAFLSAESGTVTEWSVRWLSLLARYLTFHPGIRIYPHRYDKIRPVLERLYGLDLPDYADEVKKLETNDNAVFVSPEEAQIALINLGYDLGPSGADGVFGTKSTKALKRFEKQANIYPADGVIDSRTLSALERALEEKGLESLT